MKKTLIAATILSLTALATGQAFASDTAGLTRGQVKAALVEAQRSGTIVLNGESGMTAREAHPGRYPAKAEAAGKTRAEVLAELASATAAGDIQVGESGLTARELNPSRYPAKVEVSRSREDVLAELAQARADGSLEHNDLYVN